MIDDKHKDVVDTSWQYRTQGAFSQSEILQKTTIFEIWGTGGDINRKGNGISEES